MSDHVLHPKLSIDREVLRILPGFAAWGLMAEWPGDANLVGEGGLRLPADAGVDLATLAEHPRIAIWRAAYRAMGLKPSEYRSSVEQLVRRAARGESPRIGISAVDLYNSISVAHLVPLGGYDVDRMAANELLVRVAQPADRFEPLGGKQDEAVLAGTAIGYFQGPDCLCGAINWRDSAATAISGATRRALFVSEALDEEGAEASQAALHDLGVAIQAGGGTYGRVVPFGQV
jgi:DNA/RNA-binding domain of Phe-tRNA-synthetase-like protein